MKINVRLFCAVICAVMLMSLLCVTVAATIDNNAKVELPEGSTATLDPETVVSITTSDVELSEQARANLDLIGYGGGEVFVIYDIALLLDGVEVKPGGEVKITLTVPESITKYSAIKVVFVDEEANGAAVPCDTMVNGDGTISFTGEYYSHIAILGVYNNGSNSLMVVIIVVVFALSCFLIFGRRRNMPTPAKESDASADSNEGDAFDEYADANEPMEYNEDISEDTDDKDAE